jgi:hypothetical protein
MTTTNSRRPTIRRSLEVADITSLEANCLAWHLTEVFGLEYDADFTALYSGGWNLRGIRATTDAAVTALEALVKNLRHVVENTPADAF